jgi:hypothetical protein
MIDDEMDELALQRRRRWLWVLGCVGALFAFACMLTLLAVLAGIFLLNQVTDSEGGTPTQPTAVVSSVLGTATPQPSATPSPTSEATATAVPTEAPTATATVTPEPTPTQVVFSAPPRDYYEVAQRLGDFDVGERTVVGTIYSADDIGVEKQFFVDDRKVTAVLVSVTDRTYFWVDDKLAIDYDGMQAVAERFDQDLYPVLVDLFGSEWSPGVDNDPHFSVVHLETVPGGGELGFFVPGNQYPRTIERFSNEQEVIFMNMAELSLGEDLYYGTLVHEVQHLIHWNQDSNEESWLDEGLGQLAEIVNGYETAETVDYMLATDTQLNSWEYEDEEAVFAHYAGAYLFSVYLWEQLGDEAIRDLVRDPANGMNSVRNVLATYRPEQSLERFVADWAVANLLDDVTLDESYGYGAIDPGLPQMGARTKQLPSTVEGELPPFGVDYVAISADGPVSVTFSAETQSEIFPPSPTGNELVWYAPPSDNLDATLTTELDLSGETDPTFTFWAWYDLEADYDFAYVLVSADAGATWTIVEPDHAIGGEYGPAIGGQSGDLKSAENDWIAHSVDLNDYVDQTILLRVEMLTDSAVSGSGLALDMSTSNVTGAWLADGFIRHDGILTPNWLVQFSGSDVIGLPEFSAGAGTTVTLDVPGEGVLIIINVQEDALQSGQYELVVGDSAE